MSIALHHGHTPIYHPRANVDYVVQAENQHRTLSNT